MSAKCRWSVGEVSVNWKLYRPTYISTDVSTNYQPTVSRPTINQLATDYRPSLDHYLTDIAVDISADTTYSKHDPIVLLTELSSQLELSILGICNIPVENEFSKYFKWCTCVHAHTNISYIYFLIFNILLADNVHLHVKHSTYSLTKVHDICNAEITKLVVGANRKNK